MAYVLRCDACGKVEKPERGGVVTLYNIFTGNLEERVEVCSDCYGKVSKILKNREENNNGK